MLRPELTRTHAAAVPCVDVHTHFFNARDVPVRAFLQKSVGQDMAPSAAEEWRDLQEMRQRFAGMAPAEATARLDAEASDRAEEVGKALYRETRRRAPDAIAPFDSQALEAEPAGGDWACASIALARERSPRYSGNLTSPPIRARSTTDRCLGLLPVK